MENNTQQYSVDLGKVVEQVKALREQETKLQKQQEALTKAFKEGKINEQQYNTATKQLNAQLQATKQRLQDTANATKNLAQQAKQGKGGLQEMAKQGIDLQNALGKVWGIMQGGLQQIANGFDGWRQKQEQVKNEMHTLYESMKQNEKEYQNILKDRQEMYDRWALEDAQRSGDNDAIKLALQKEINKAVEKQSKLEEDLKTATENVAKAKENQANQGRFIVQGQTDSVTLAKKVESAEKKVLEIEKEKTKAQDDLRKSKQALADFEKKLADEEQKRLDDAEKARLKALEEQQRKAKELAEKRKQEIEKDKQNRLNAEKAIEDIEIQLIEDANERQLAQIELNKQRALSAIDEIYDKSSAETKEQLDIQKQAINELAKYQAIQVKYGTDVFKHNSVELDNATKQQLDLMKSQLVGAKKLREELSIQLNTLEEERLNNLKKEQEAYDKLIEQIKKANISEQDRLTQTEEAQRVHATNLENITANSNLKKEKSVLESNERINQSNAQLISSWANVGGSISSILGTLAEQEEEGSKKQIRLKKASIYISMAQAMAQGISSAMEMPFPANLVAGVATLAELIALFAQVTSMEDKAQYAQGGFVQGKGSGTSDSISARLSNGEYVVNQQSTSANLPLLESINRGDGSYINAIVGAISNIQPIVAVESIERQTTKYNNTKVYSHI